jgi:hypothetical protein
VPLARINGAAGQPSLTIMTAKLASKLLWRKIERHIKGKDERVRVRPLARRFGLAPSNVSRGLRRRKIHPKPTGYPWEAASNHKGKAQVQKCRKSLALYFLGLNREQIERLVPIKSETLKGYLLALTFEVSGPETQPYRMFHEDAPDSLARELDKAYGLGDHVREFFEQQPNLFAPDPSEFLRQLRRYEPPPAVLVRKLRQILRSDVRRHGLEIHLMGRNGRRVRVQTLAPNEMRTGNSGCRCTTAWLAPD